MKRRDREMHSGGQNARSRFTGIDIPTSNQGPLGIRTCLLTNVVPTEVCQGLQAATLASHRGILRTPVADGYFSDHYFRASWIVADISTDANIA